MGLVVRPCHPLSSSKARSLPFPVCTAPPTLQASLRSPARGGSLAVECLGACRSGCDGSSGTMPEVADTCSLASPASVCRTQHLHLRCSVDFARRALTGTAALTVQSQEDNLRSLVRGAPVQRRFSGAASPPTPRPCSPRDPRSLALPAWPPLRAAAPLFVRSHASLALNLTFASALCPSPST